jgi:hypothetical protein
MASAISSRRALLDPGARERVGRAKLVVALGCIAGFAAAFGLTKASHPSHTKHPLKRLDAPGGFVKQIQESQLRGGVISAPQAPPEAQTSVS